VGARGRICGGRGDDRVGEARGVGAEEVMRAAFPTDLSLSSLS
jgi:hypothetical protein